jgi:glycosyltransferase involved in cell wall biosynthesis
MDTPNERISFPKPLPNETAVLNWLDTQDFFVLPTRSEGFGRCVAEAMSRGCVCFATDICTMPELLAPECLHPLDDDVTLKSLIETFAGNKDKMIANAKRNFDKAKEYDFEVLRTRRNAFLEKFKAYCEQQK